MVAREGFPLRFGYGDSFEQALVVLVCFKRLCPCRVARDLEVAPLARHAVLALCPVRVGAESVAEVDELVGFSFACRPAFDGVPVKQNLNDRRVALEVPGIDICLRQLVR